MMPLGNVTHSLPSVARKASMALQMGGRIAVYVGTTGNAVAIPRSDDDYVWQINRQRRYLVGVYDDDLRDNDGFPAQLIGDIRAHVADLRVRSAA